eukprot:m.239107 g.239107  ORF g.239107 m.239107 type:complete len:141 (+) comp19404_c0_seq15:2321-2743(+)
MIRTSPDNVSATIIFPLPSTATSCGQKKDAAAASPSALPKLPVPAKRAIVTQIHEPAGVVFAEDDASFTDTLGTRAYIRNLFLVAGLTRVERLFVAALTLQPIHTTRQKKKVPNKWIGTRWYHLRGQLKERDSTSEHDYR